MRKCILLCIILSVLCCFSGCMEKTPKVMTKQETIQCINNKTVDKYKGYETELRGYVSNTVGKYNNAELGFELSFDERSDIINNVLIDIEDVSDSINYSELDIGTPVKVTATATKQNNIAVFTAKTVQVIDETEVVNSTIEEISINAEETHYGNAVVVEKIQLAENETRIFVKVKNEKDEKFSLDGISIVQGSTNYSDWYAYEDIYGSVELAKGTEKQVVYYIKEKLLKEDMNFTFYISSDYFMNIPCTSITKYQMNIDFENGKCQPYLQPSIALGSNFVLDTDFFDENENYYITKVNDDSFVVYMPWYIGEFLGTYDIDIVLADRECWYADIPTYVYLDTTRTIKYYNQ